MLRRINLTVRRPKSTNYQACGLQLIGATCIQPMLVRHIQRLLRHHIDINAIVHWLTYCVINLLTKVKPCCIGNWAVLAGWIWLAGRSLPTIGLSGAWKKAKEKRKESRQGESRTANHWSSSRNTNHCTTSKTWQSDLFLCMASCHETECSTGGTIAPADLLLPASGR